MGGRRRVPRQRLAYLCLALIISRNLYHHHFATVSLRKADEAQPKGFTEAPQKVHSAAEGHIARQKRCPERHQSVAPFVPDMTLWRLLKLSDVTLLKQSERKKLPILVASHGGLAEGAVAQ